MSKIKICDKPRNVFNTRGKLKNISDKNQHLYYTKTKGKLKNISVKIEPLYYTIFSDYKPCLDKQIFAVIKDDTLPEVLWFGSNRVTRCVNVCIRNKAKCKINSGYEYCRIECGQNHHAEAEAIYNWLDSTDTVQEEDGMKVLRKHQAKMYVYGAKRICNECRSLCGRYGVEIVEVNHEEKGILKWIQTKQG